MDERCFPRIVISGTKEFAYLPDWDIKTDYTGEYGLVNVKNGKPVYKHAGPARSEGTKYPGTTGAFYLFFVSTELRGWRDAV